MRNNMIQAAAMMAQNRPDITGNQQKMQMLHTLLSGDQQAIQQLGQQICQQIGINPQMAAQQAQQGLGKFGF